MGLIHASKATNVDLVQRLLHGLHQHVPTALQTQRSVLDHRDSHGWTALMHACNVGSLPIAKALLNAGADASISTAGFNFLGSHAAGAVIEFRTIGHLSINYFDILI